MKELCISNIDYYDAKSLARKHSYRLNRAGCGIYIDSVNDRMVIKWRAIMPAAIISILDFIHYAFCDDTVYNEQNILKLKKSISNLEDDHAIILDSNNGEFEIREL